MMEIPTANVVPLKYEIKENKSKISERTGTDLCRQIEFLNCYVEIKGVKSYICENNKLIFY
jgi:CRISPR-associated protein Cas5t